MRRRCLAMSQTLALNWSFSTNSENSALARCPCQTCTWRIIQGHPLTTFQCSDPPPSSSDRVLKPRPPADRADRRHTCACPPQKVTGGHHAAWSLRELIEHDWHLQMVIVLHSYVQSACHLRRCEWNGRRVDDLPWSPGPWICALMIWTLVSSSAKLFGSYLVYCTTTVDRRMLLEFVFDRQ
jgi:hypothetical protein